MGSRHRSCGCASKGDTEKPGGGALQSGHSAWWREDAGARAPSLRAGGASQLMTASLGGQGGVKTVSPGLEKLQMGFSRCLGLPVSRAKKS